MYSVISQCEHWSVTLGTSVYSFRTKIKVQICKYACDVPKSGCLQPSSALRSNPSLLPLHTSHFTLFCYEVKSNRCVLRWTQPHFQALFSVMTDNGMFMVVEFKHIEYTRSCKTMAESLLGNALSFVVLHTSYGDCSYLSCYK